MATWPIDIELPRQGEVVTLQVQQKSVTIERIGPHHLELRDEQHPDGIIIGSAPAHDTLRFIPSFGPLSLLLLPTVKLLCPSQHSFDIVMAIPLYLVMGIGTKQTFQRVTDFAPPRVPRALYGPVDAGTLCRSVHTRIYRDLQGARNDVGIHEETDSATDMYNPNLTAPTAAILKLELSNTTAQPLELSKIMIPLEHLGIYEEHGDIMTTQLHMTLLGELEAQLRSSGAPSEGASPVNGLDGLPLVPVPKSTLFAHSYRQKTGLEFGF